MKRRACNRKTTHFSDANAEIEHREWLRERYAEAWKLIVLSMQHENQLESTQALVTAMRLLSVEGKHPRDSVKNPATFPTTKLSNILQRILSNDRVNTHLINRFKEYGAYLDVVFHTWKILPGLTLKGNAPTDTYIQNFLELVNTVPINAQVQENKQVLCCADGTFEFDYPTARKCLNKVWACAILWNLSDTTHKQFLIVLLERILSHLDKPVLLTDFLMDSLDVGRWSYSVENRIFAPFLT